MARGSDRWEFEPVEETARSRLAYRASEDGRPPGEERHDRTCRAVVLEGGGLGDELVRVLFEVLGELKAVKLGLSLLVEQEL